MTAKNFILEYKYSGIAIFFVVLISYLIFRQPFDQEGKVKGINYRINLTEYQPLDSNFVKAQAAVSAILKQPSIPTTDPLYTIQGIYEDINSDGKKELIAKENWMGASGWSDKLSIFQLNKLNLKSIFEKTFENSVVYFESNKIYQIEPYYDEDFSRSEINKILVTVMQWNGQNYSVMSKDIYELPTNPML